MNDPEIVSNIREILRDAFEQIPFGTDANSVWFGVILAIKTQLKLVQQNEGG